MYIFIQHQNNKFIKSDFYIDKNIFQNTKQHICFQYWFDFSNDFWRIMSRWIQEYLALQESQE